jgi:alkyl sulfatase BDS1-like metallo-beta-lactamase superfamily hydrolase
VEAEAVLREHSKLFERGVEKVAERIHVAIGWGIANSILVEGDDGVLVVDTMESREQAAEVLAEFRKITEKPIRAIIYTHNHPDHVMGAQAFAEGGRIEIYAHETTDYYVNRIATKMRLSIDMRSARMYGLNHGGVVNVGIGPFVALGPDSSLGYLPPTRTFAEELEDEVAGIPFRLFHAPGETDDQLFVWLPEDRALLPGDNFYWAFPNLYTLRGTPFRSLEHWYRSIDTIRQFEPDYLIPSHSRPIVGRERIAEVLKNYRDAIQYVHDQAVRGMNLGMTPDELAEHIELPPHLAELPYLQPFYGRISWSVRSMFAGHLGWFDGDPATIEPLTARQRAELFASLAGGEEELLEFARTQLEEGEPQAALELTSLLAQLDVAQRADEKLRTQALRSLAAREANPNARNWYLSEVAEIEKGEIARTHSRPSPEFIERLPLEKVLRILATHLDPVASSDLDQRVRIRFADQRKAFTIHVRRGVAEIRPGPWELDGEAESAIVVTADSRSWKEMLAQLRGPVRTLASYRYEKGNAISFGRFLSLFELPEPKLPFRRWAD